MVGHGYHDAITKSNETTVTQDTAQVLLGAFLALAGTSHLTWARSEFTAQVPKWLPMNEDLVVVLSGVVEIILGGSLVFARKQRARVGSIAALFFIVVFPGNVSQYKHHIDAFGLNSDKARFARLFFQPVLISWALWSSGAWRSWRRKKLM